MSDTATLDTNDPAAMAALSEKRIAALKDDGTLVTDKGSKTETPPASKGGDAPAATEKVTPDSDGPNLSHIPEKFRSHFASIPAEALEWTRAGTVRHADVQTAKNESKAAKDALAKAEKAAAAWEDFKSNPARVKAMMAWDAKQSGGTPADATDDDEVPDYPNLTPKEVQAHIRRQIDQGVSSGVGEAVRKALEQFEAKYIAPATSTHSANTALAQYAKEHGYTAEQIQAATDKARAYLEANGVDSDSWNGDNAVTRIEEFLPATAPAKSNGTARGAAAAATPSRGGAAVAPSPVPAWQREGRAPNESERLGAIAHTLEARYGKRVTEAQIADAIARK